jgi:hypothetical protein
MVREEFRLAPKICEDVMRDKYSTKSPLMQILHKYTGFIVMGIILVIAVPLYFDYEENKEFFHSFSCQKTFEYMTGTTFGFTPHDELKQSQHIELHKIYQGCTSEKFTPHNASHLNTIDRDK